MEQDSAALMQTRGNIMAWCQSLRFAPGWLLANNFPLDKVNSPWPFESQLMAEVLEAFTKKRSPRHEDLLLLTMCSSTGQVCPDMQPSRPQSSRNIEALIQAMRQFIHVSPNGDMARRFLRHASAATSLFISSSQLVIEANLPYRSQSQQAPYLRVLALGRKEKKEKKRNPAAVCDDARPMTKAQYKKAQQEMKKSHARTVRGLRNMSKQGMFPYQEPFPPLPSPPTSLPELLSSSSSSPPQPQPQPSSSTSPHQQQHQQQQHHQHHHQQQQQQHNGAATVDHDCDQLSSMLQQSLEEEQYQGEDLHQDLLQFIQELEQEAQQQPEAGAAEPDLEPAGAPELALEEDQQQEEGFLDEYIVWAPDQEKQQPSEQLPEQDGTCELDAEDQRLFRLLEQALGRS
ncbi:hypothetical protein C2857_006490 [Epichloe festucae Fl1]|uniref:Uncharacterized protein n=1 Tax=Epichloe festucae (strain Fl1) TaxID=877507 RepID=A0A7S9PW98_EPIFF|nr:hypothetical protein C2857_006490 [Epichloe festucae Fl1]